MIEVWACCNAPIQARELTMRIEGLEQAPFNTTLLGVVRGVADFFEIDVSDAMLFGATGHAFVINIHEELCPSGPYCWNRERFHALLKNLGIEMVDRGFFGPESSAKEREKIESTLIMSVDRGLPCSLLNLENQLITGYYETEFATAQPWAAKMDFPPKYLTFGSWDEFGDKCHVNFYTFDRCDSIDRREVILASLDYAIDLFANPTSHTHEPYGMGFGAYSRFIEAVEAGHGSSHGNWWNGIVWTECRSMASQYFEEIAIDFVDLAEEAKDLAKRYASIAEDLSKVSDKEMDKDEKVALLQRIADEEGKAVGKVAACADALRSSVMTP